jgi:hypothetical protein
MLNNFLILYRKFWQAPSHRLQLTVGRALLKSARIWNSPLASNTRQFKYGKNTFISSATKKPMATAE